ncbi:hypothetical protein [Isoptericola sp. NPDC056605]|uniref:hypothetical protein n=1 Tax=Isoptericola sp. NPDC056605 TaxID=3345876 RepID=UPI0036A242BB
MPQLSRTNVLTSLTALAGVVAAVGFAISSTEVGGAALGVAVVLLAGLVHSVGRTLATRIDEGTDGLTAKADLVLAGQKKSDRAAAAHAEHADAMARRIVADVGAARLEAAERGHDGVR